MEGASDAQRDHLLGPPGGCQVKGLRYAHAIATDDDLLGRVDVGDVGPGRSGDLLHCDLVQTQYGGHSARVLVACVLHELAAGADQMRGLGHIENAATARAVYSPRLWPAMRTGWGMASGPSFSSIALTHARLTAMMAGWALAVSRSSSSGPLNRSFVSGVRGPCPTWWNTDRAAGDPSVELLAHAHRLGTLAREEVRDLGTFRLWHKADCHLLLLGARPYSD